MIADFVLLRMLSFFSFFFFVSTHSEIGVVQDSLHPSHFPFGQLLTNTLFSYQCTYSMKFIIHELLCCTLSQNITELPKNGQVKHLPFFVFSAFGSLVKKKCTLAYF